MGRQRDPLTAVRWMLDGLLLVVVLVVAAAFAVARGLPALGHETVVVTGRSMETTVPLGSMAVLERVAPAAIGAGDVVTVRIPESGTVFTHRVVQTVERADGLWLQTRGDANDAPDPALVPVGWVDGRVTSVIPWLGYVVLLLSMVTGMLMILSLSLALYLAARLVEDLEWERARARRARSRAKGPSTAVPEAAPYGPGPLPGSTSLAEAPPADPAHRHAAALRRERRGGRLRRWQA
jgi:signal peptidase